MRVLIDSTRLVLRLMRYAKPVRAHNPKPDSFCCGEPVELTTSRRIRHLAGVQASCTQPATAAWCRLHTRAALKAQAGVPARRSATARSLRRRGNETSKPCVAGRASVNGDRQRPRAKWYVAVACRILSLTSSRDPTRWHSVAGEMAERSRGISLKASVVLRATGGASQPC